MSLTTEQKKLMKEISKRLREIERLGLENKIDLDVFMTNYNEEGVSLYSTESISQKKSAGKRKNVFEKHSQETRKAVTKK